MRTAALALLLAVALLARSTPATAAPPDAAITAHAIEIRFDPAAHAFVARDRVTIAPAGPALLRFVLPKQVTVRGLATADGAAVEVSPVDGAPEGLVLHQAKVPDGVSSLTLAYGGVIFDAVEKQENLAWVVGDSTRGLISEKGIYLNGGSGWYPRTERDRMLRFDVTSWIPAPFLVVTQGRPPVRSTVQVPAGWSSDTEVEPPAITAEAKATVAFAKSVALAEIPSDGCDLVAGPYVEQVREVKGIQVATYFLPGEAADAGLWLDAAAEVVARYEPILGTYPHKKFDVVENFFSTGYGMPSFTLLGDDVIRYVTAGAKSTGKIPPGYLDHEYVHGWFGNGLFVDPADGNWCEGSTTYYSNYLAKELESPAAAVEHRRGVLEKYAIRITPENDYPVRSFASKTEDKDNDVGYGKASMIFHVLRRRLGDTEFFARVKKFSQDRVGTHVSWDDWLTLLDGAWATPYLARKGLPLVRLASATTWPAADGTWHVRAEAVVDQPRGEAPWPDMDLDVDVDGVKAGTLRLAGKSGVWRGVSKTQPKTLELDARYETLRAIAPTDLPACLNRTLESPGARVVVDGTPAFDAVAKKISAGKGLPVVAAADAKDDGTPSVTLLLLKPDATFRFPAEGRFPAGGDALVEATPTSVKLGGATHAGAGLSFLFSAPATRRADGTLAGARTWFVACDEKALGRANYLTYYGWDQFAAFQAGNRTPIGRGFLDRTPQGTHRAVTTDAAAARVAADVEHLSGDAFGGRAPGTPGHDAARAWLSDRLESLAAGGAVALAEQAFGLGVPELTSSRDLAITTSSGTEVLKDAFRPLWGSPDRAPGELPYGDGAGAIPLPGRLPDTSAEGLARFWRQVEDGTAPAIFVAPSAEARVALAPFLDTPASLTAASQAELDKPGRDGKPRPRPSLPQWISGRRARAFPGAGPLRVPVLVLEESAIAALEAKKPTKVDFAVTWGPPAADVRAGRGGVNLVAVFPAKDAPETKPPAVLVCAHYDSFGTVAGKVFRGADDNATGVACVLEAVRGLPATVTSGGTKHSLIVVLFDGEEWGLVGSRAVAATLSTAYDLRAVVAVDSVGRVRDDTVFVIGQSTHIDLGAAAVAALPSAGLRAGADIDKFAFADGSDHFPFHQQGVPSILLWASDYGVMNTADDDPALVDPVGVARLATALRGLLTNLLTR